MTEEYLSLLPLNELHILMAQSIDEIVAMHDNKKVPVIIIKGKQSQIELIHKVIAAKKEHTTVKHSI